ncbi:MAG TPA: hypothetical protein VF981_04770 [Gemmatimonadaceae bacterium]
MSRTTNSTNRMSVVRSRVLVVAASLVAGVVPTAATAQDALGVPFIGSNNLSFYTAQLTRDGGAETTTLLGMIYAHRFGAANNPTRMSLQLRGSARPFEDVSAGILDVATRVSVSHDVRAVRGLSVAGSLGAGVTAWGDDRANTGRLHVSLPASGGVSYDIRLGGVTISPFASASIARYDLRTYLDEERQSMDRGWDASYTTGTSLRVRDIVVTTSRIAGEQGMPDRSRWAFTAGISF